MVCDLGPGPATDALVVGVGLVVHVEPALALPRHGGAGGWLDVCTQGTYNLLYAATEAGVAACCCLSSMELFAPYDRGLAVQPFWEPRPSCEPAALGLHSRGP